jgi:hypothetical protein
MFASFAIFIFQFIHFGYSLTSGDVSYQIHSANDLSEWRQLLLKGATRFKIDPHYVPSSTCILNGIDSAKGCFLLSHDDPKTDLVKYNSTDELVTFLYSEEFQNLRFDNISIALCFKRLHFKQILFFPHITVYSFISIVLLRSAIMNLQNSTIG